MYVKYIEFDIFIRVVNKCIVHEIVLTKECRRIRIRLRTRFLSRTGRTDSLEKGQISVCNSNMVRPPHQFSSAGGEERFHGT